MSAEKWMVQSEAAFGVYCHKALSRYEKDYL